MKKSIVKKMFLSLLILMIVVMSIQLIFQNFLLEDIYRHIKIAKVEKRFDSFIEDYKNLLNGDLDDDANEMLRHYEEDSSASIIAIKGNFNVMSDHFFEAFNYILAKDELGVEYKLLIDFLVDERGIFRNENINLQAGDAIVVDLQNINGTDFYDVLSIKRGSMVYENDSEIMLINALYESKINTNVNLKISEINFINREDGVISYQNVKLLNEVSQIYTYNEFSNEEFEEASLGDSYSFVEEYSGQELIVLTQNIITEDASYVNVFSLFAVEKVSSAFKVLNIYYIYFLVFQILLVTVLTYIYSRWITKPLINLIDVSKDISELNFDNKYSYKSGDELGALSNSLDSISTNLSSTIDYLKKSNDELAIEAIKKQENEDRMRNLLNNLSHEFKTPLGVISGFIEIISDKVYEKDPEYYMNVIEEEVEKLNLMVKDTLELSKLEMGGYLLKLSEIELDKLVKSSVLKFEYQIKEKNFDIKIDLEESIVSADKVKINQVLDNLISNAIKYTDVEGKIEISIRNFKDESIFAIRNYNVEFSEGELSQIWDRFYVREKSRSKNSDGTGLGLTIVKNILELHNSNYGVKNIKGGVEFYFSLKKYR